MACSAKAARVLELRAFANETNSSSSSTTTTTTTTTNNTYIHTINSNTNSNTNNSNTKRACARLRRNSAACSWDAQIAYGQLS